MRNSRFWVSLRENRDLPAFNALVTFGRAILGALAVVLALFFGLRSALGVELAIAVGLGVLLLLVSTAYSLSLVKSRRERRIQEMAKNPNVYFHRMDKTCRVRSNLHLIYNTRNDVEVLKDRLDHYNMSYYWSGDGDVAVTLNSPAGKVIVSEADTSSRVSVKFIFDRPLEKGAREIVDFDMESRAISKPPKSYFSESIFDVINGPGKLSISIVFDDPTSVRRVWTEESAAFIERGPIKPGPDIPLSKLGVARYEWDHPASGRKYAIRWEFVD